MPQLCAQCELTEVVKRILACGLVAGGLVTGAANVVGWGIERMVRECSGDVW